ncbi:MAG: GNAT family N-acetyltransferase [Bacteroidetes bacterium]|nr:GNAT family N-acetyltransferase [Bacteroidota bacterium]MBU1719859.1 GNAT family N-acetyltransferase [Bacteroidota bacterium]
MKYLEGKLIYLRAIEPSDAALVQAWENNPDLWHLGNTTTPFSKFFIEEYIRNHVHDIYTEKQLRLMVCKSETHEPVGTIDLFDFDPNNQRAGIGILVASESNRRNGYASESVRLLCEYCFNVLNINQLFCNILVTNLPSISLFEKEGFVQCGEKKAWVKCGEEWIDEQIFQKFRPGFATN